MRGLVNKYRINPLIRQTATSLVQNVPAKNWTAEIAACFNYVRNNIRYTLDINGVETIQTPLATLTLRHGDCDDMSILLASLLEAIGYETKFVAIGFEPGCFDHVYLEARNPDTGEWIAADPTEPYQLGWSAAPEAACRIDFVEN